MELIRNKPVAQFFYKGTHSHPVQRTVLITEQNRDVLTGYEIRSGREIREMDDAPIKTFSRDKIAMTNQLRGGSKVKNGVSTLERMSITQLKKAGV